MAADYLKLLPSLHADQPNFSAWLGALTKPFADIYDAIVGITQAFDVDTAVGQQLDILGLWVGIERKQRVPITNSFFTWDTTGLGWGQSNWKGPYEPTEGIVNLDDSTYRSLIQAKIGANYWQGTIESLVNVNNGALSSVGVQCFVLDNFDMSTTVYIMGAPTKALIELIKRGVTPPKAAGVRVTGYILASTPGAPFFALSVSTTSEVAGLDFGSFGDPV